MLDKAELKVAELKDVVGGAGGTITCWSCKASPITPARNRRKTATGTYEYFYTCPCCGVEMNADGTKVSIY